MKNENVIVVKKAIKIEEGKHNGFITDFKKSDTSKYNYVDVFIQLDDYIDVQPIKVGFSCKNWEISELSSLGIFLRDSGLKFVEDDELTFDKIKTHLIDKKATFTTYNDEKGFARVPIKTISFIKE